MGLPCLNVYTIHNMITYQLLSHVFLTHVLTLAIRNLWVTCALANPPPYSSFLLVSYKSITKMSPKWPKYPWVFPNISNFGTSYFSSYIRSFHLELLELDKSFSNSNLQNPTELGHGSCQGTRVVSTGMTRVVSTGLHNSFQNMQFSNFCSKSFNPLR